MLLRIPNFYTKFHCIADKCTDSCCIGWEIDIDPKTFSKYKTVPGEFGKKLKANICDGHFILQPGNRCPFLNEQGLCDVYKNLGANALGDICREHPRFVEVYGDIMEKGVGLCCEEAARLLLNRDYFTSKITSKDNAFIKNSPIDAQNTEPTIQFIENEIDDIPDELPDDARKARDQIFIERENMFIILGQSEIPLNKRLQMLLEYAVHVSGIYEENFEDSLQKSTSDKTNKPIDTAENDAADIANIYHSWIEILGKGESFGPAWDKAYKAINENGWFNFSNKSSHIKKNHHESLFSDEDGAKIVTYMLFRYYAKSLFDGDSLGKVQFAIFYWIVLRDFGQELAGISKNGTPAADPKNKFIDPRIAAVKLLSKQVEYSDEVMDLLADAFASDEAFSVEKFSLLLREK